MKILKRLCTLFLLLFLACILLGVGYYLAVTREVRLSPEKLLFSEKTLTLYDRDGNTVRSFASTGLKESTPISELPDHVKSAFVDTEDKRFYSHNGFDYKRIGRALLNNVKARSFKEGASTISQQLIKNTHLSQEKTLKRKLREWKLTRQLEKSYTKEEIFERYLNTIYFGHSCFGITSASEYYFGKRPSELSLADAAILAGLVKSPNRYSPFKSPERCALRKQTVLSAMLKNGSITKEELSVAKNTPLPNAPTAADGNGYLAFVFDELTTLSEAYGFTVGGRVELYTYLDEPLQGKVEKIAQSHGESDKCMLVCGADGNFKACVSTVGNVKRLPGSLIKPLLVYAPALEENILSPATPILDEKINYGGYSPENYDGKYHGYVSARECVEKSLNIPAVKTLESLTVERGAQYLQKLGLSVNEEDKSLALALGGMKEGYSLKELISAYSALQNAGIYQNCSFLSEVKINGRTVYAKKTIKNRAFGEDTAYLATNMMIGTAKNGTAKKLRSLPFEIAAKTGTVGTKKGNTDAYALSYTTNDCVGVWLGNADNSCIQTTGGGAPCSLLYEINQALYQSYERENKQISDFPVPKSVRRVDLDKASYYDTHTLSLADESSPENYRFSELFKKSAIPLNKSTFFTSPTISTPHICVENNRAVITFDERCPTCYGYKIQRYDYVTHTTIYVGELPTRYIDEGLSEGKNYVYTVIPFYKENEGVPIVLPTVTTKTEVPPNIDDEILSKEWWEY